MYMKLPPRNLNHRPCPPHPISIYICGVTTAPRMRNGNTPYLLRRKIIDYFGSIINVSSISHIIVNLTN